MQDGGDQVKYGTNRVGYPNRPAANKISLFEKFKGFLQDESHLNESTTPKVVLANKRPFDIDSRELKFHFTKEFKTSKLKAKAKKLGVTVNDIFTGSVVKAVADVSTHTKESKVSTMFAYAVKSQDEDLVNFKPENQVSSCAICYDFKETLTEQILESQNISKRFKDGKIGFGHDLFSNLLLSLAPNWMITNEGNDTFHQKVSVYCSNMAAS